MGKTLSVEQGAVQLFVGPEDILSSEQDITCLSSSLGIRCGLFGASCPELDTTRNPSDVRPGLP